jgi:tetratricopeptide (TPR) repeat protein
MPRGADGEGVRYRAFISYSHRDAAFGRKLHRSLETYRLPRRLVGQPTALGPAPRRLMPIFRDLDELPAANDLTEKVRSALAASDTLIVVCSPAAAQSRWVTREVEVFRQLHPDRPILLALLRGEPSEAFPAALRPTGLDDGSPEPLAADFRPHHDGARLAFLKLVAGILGLGLDDLLQRDAQRRVRRVMAVTIGALATMLAMGASTVFALQAQAEAERQRAQAEGLIEFMLTDLRTRLKEVGRLDVMSAVNSRVLDYYRDQDLDHMPPASLERRARLLLAMGEDNETRGDLKAAAAQFNEASRTTAALLAEKPDDPERIFDHAQSEFWLASVDFQAGRKDQAIRGYLAYERLAGRLVAMAPKNPIYLRELAYAEGDLCAAALLRPERPTDGPTAVRWCTSALSHMQAAAARMDAKDEIQSDLINRHAWLADAYCADGKLERARAERLEEDKLLEPLLAADPKNQHLREHRVALHRALAQIDMLEGRPDLARQHLDEAREGIDEMLAFEPANERWRRQRDKVTEELADPGRLADPNSK